jgi:transposase-like protein
MINEVFFEELLSRQQESGLNVRDFCSNEGIHPSTFYYWLKKHREKNSPKAFIPLAIQNTFAVQRPEKICTMMGSKASPADQGTLLEFVFPNGTRVLLKQQPDMALLKVMAHLYD